MGLNGPTVKSNGPILGSAPSIPSDIGTRISTDISTQTSVLAVAVSTDISTQVDTLTSVISTDISTQQDTLATQLSTQFANRHII